MPFFPSHTSIIYKDGIHDSVIRLLIMYTNKRKSAVSFQFKSAFEHNTAEHNVSMSDFTSVVLRCCQI